MEAAQGRLRAGTIDVVTLATTQTAYFQNQDTLEQVRLARYQAALDAFDADDSPYSDAPAPPPPTPGFAFPAAEDFTRAYRAGRLTPQDVASRFIAQWNASDTGPRPLRAMIAVCDVMPPRSVMKPA